MDDSAKLLKLVMDGYQSSDNAVRAKAEMELKALWHHNANALITLCCNIIDEPKTSMIHRKLICTYLQSNLNSSDEDFTALALWKQLTKESKDNIKATGLSGLISTDAGFMIACASLIATAFVLDCQTDRTWGDIIGSLSSNVTHQKVAIQTAAMSTLGYICDLLNKKQIVNLPDEQIDLLLTGICKGLKVHNELTITAITAFDNSIQFLRAKLKEENIADFIMELLITLLRDLHKNAKDSEEERSLIYLLAKLAKMLFNKLDRYHALLFTEVRASYSASPLIIVATNQFFISMIKQCEKNKVTYMNNFWKDIMEFSLKKITEFSDFNEEEEQGESSTVFSILDMMTAINRVYFAETFPVLRDFVTKYIELDSENNKLCALLAYESLIEMPDSPTKQQFFKNGFFGLLNYLKSGTTLIRKYSIRLLVKIVRRVPEVFLDDENFNPGVKVLLTVMKIEPGERADQSDAIHNIRGHAALIFIELIEATRRAGASAPCVTLLRSVTDNLFQIVLSSGVHSNNIFVMDSYFSALFEFINKVIDPKLYCEYLSQFNDYIRRLFAIDDKNYEQIFEFVFMNMTVLVTKIGQGKSPMIQHGQMTYPDLLKQIYLAIDLVVKKHQKIIPEAIVLMVTILAVDKATDPRTIETCIETYINPVIQNTQNIELFKAGIESICMLVKRFEGNLATHVDQYFQYFIQLLKSDKIEKDMKIYMFIVLSDFVLHVPAVAGKYLPDALRLAELALKAIVHFQGSGQKFLRDYAEAFKEVIIEFYLCVVHGVYLKVNEFDSAIEESMKYVFEFVALTVKDELNPTITYLNTSLGLLIDFFSKKSNPQMINYEVIEYLYRSLSKVRNFGEVSSTLEYAKNYFSTL